MLADMSGTSSNRSPAMLGIMYIGLTGFWRPID